MVDDAAPPEDERMSDAEFRVVREFLGLSVEWLASYLGVSVRTVRQWEQGRDPVPEGVRAALEDIERRTDAFVDGLVGKILDIPDPCVRVYRSDEEYHAAHPDVEFPARWHRHVLARIAREVPGLRFAYPPEDQ
ncbi:helix-turn-helix domain-containing protein [Salinispora arenicola]|uniref:helix-turn-helix domain-containing protein n=1 Tax=Salinispora arenicola TaxID=168697 RepID=UPI00036172A0|nr:DUF1870 family protein [Salinispora arenicola]